MKKLTLLTVILAITTSTQSFAETKGHYTGINILKASAKTKTTKDASSGNGDTYFNSNSKDSATDFGVDYKYAINIDNFFVAPGLFYENIGTEALVSDSRNGWAQGLKLNNRYGVKLDFGYDLTKNFAIYIPLEYAITNYKLSTIDYDNTRALGTKKVGYSANIFYGVGVAFYPTEKVSINLQYTRSNPDFKSSKDVALVNTVGLKARTTLDIIKLGVAYHF